MFPQLPLSFLCIQESEIKIYNILGKWALTVETQNSVSLQRSDISFLSSDIYYVRLGDWRGVVL
ncbi:MAG: T9SS type A sorting domain-containing protein [Candidatus Kapabacteria bacterium]|nr:T9SS type A sorting domain-containing protein [Candidatus Kapabacteria bacterium]